MVSAPAFYSDNPSLNPDSLQFLLSGNKGLKRTKIHEVKPAEKWPVF